MRAACVSLVLILMASSTASAQGPRVQRRPCGPGSGRNLIRLFIPQGLLGADFKPACRLHDNDYSQHGKSKQEADRAFFDRLNCACDQSLTPRLCRWMSQLMYAAVSSPWGQHSFRLGQIHP